ncbi:hypothetical protein [Allonocardiopsis opalescens]|uniref:Uncharacterized protein n=1 Tax=Allonocardiopsis opalescens TaxID=1144618 RepID=A0A2T0PYK3_9ACTN|nr:hypothetical protein [Allonocardiopsis opalescens]PRX96610.1 hypothetical protein CLV72_107133 [Allonocardiopsis opalescens]
MSRRPAPAAVRPAERRPPSGTGADGAGLARSYARIGGSDETELAVGLLSLVPLHEDRDPALLREWASRAVAFGRELAERAPHRAAAETEVVERAAGGVSPGQVLLAEYLHRSAGDRVVVYTDALDYAHRVARAAGWADDFPPPTVRAAALAHEEAHRLLHGGHGRALRDRLGHEPLRWGPLRLRGHVAGADEIAAHAYARVRCGLRRSPLALTAAIAATLDHQGTDPSGPDPATPLGDHP